MFNTKDFCQICKHYDIGSHKCSKAPERAIPKSECADYEYYKHDDLCKYCSRNKNGVCVVSGHKCNAGNFLVNICTDFENKGVMEKKLEYKRKDYLCARCANSCKWDCEMDYCDNYVAIEDAERIANANQIAALRKRCEEFMHDIVRDFKDIIVKDTAEIHEEKNSRVSFNRAKDLAYTDSVSMIDFSLKFTACKKD